MNGMKLAGVVMMLLAVGAAAMSVRQYQAESRDATLQAIQNSQGVSNAPSADDVPVSGWGVSAIGAVVLGAVGAICIAKGKGR